MKIMDEELEEVVNKSGFLFTLVVVTRAEPYLVKRYLLKELCQLLRALLSLIK